MINKDNVIIGLIIVISFTVGFLFFPLKKNLTVGIASTKTLQLKTLKFLSPTPKPPMLCPVDYMSGGGITCVAAKSCSKCPVAEFYIECKKDKCVKEMQNGYSISTAKSMDPKDTSCAPSGLGELLCKSCTQESGIICWGKPVILLYPEKPTLVNVEIVTSGEIYISDPVYPEGGWKNVLANPNGSLTYKNKSFEELFYESKVKNYGTPKTGLVFKTGELATKLPQLLFELGLNISKNEIPEFMDFWLPKLKALNSKYILVSLIEKEVKDKNDKVVISPAPDTRIEIIVYFKALEKPIELPALQIGTRPVRKGFTMVEWGGTIDSSNQ